MNYDEREKENYIVNKEVNQSDINILHQSVPTDMVRFDCTVETTEYATNSCVPVPGSEKNLQSTSMVSFCRTDEDISSSSYVKPIKSGCMVSFNDDLISQDLSATITKSEMMVVFEDGIDPKNLPDIIYYPGEFVTFEKANEVESQFPKPKLQLPEIKKQKEITIISEDQAKMIKTQQETLQNYGNAIHAAERIFKGTDFYIENGIIHNKSGEKICNFIPSIVSETVYHIKTRKGYDNRSLYKIKLYLNSSTYDVSIWGDEIYDIRWLRRATGGKATIYVGGKKNNFFNELLSDFLNSRSFEVFHYYTINGWHELPYLGYRYLYDKGIIGMINSNTYADQDHKLIYDESLVGNKSTFQGILRMMNNVCNNSSISTVLVLYAHLGVLTTLFDLAEFPIKFIVALIGVTNARKTSLALNLTKLFDRSVSPKPDISFEATAGGIETSFSKYHDAVFVIDDLKPSDSKEKQKEIAKKLEKIVRAYGDRVPTIRMNDFSPNGKDVYYPIWGCCMITGEYLDGVASTLARIVSIHINGLDVNNTELRYFQENYKILSTHMVDFLSYITDNFSSIVDFIKSRAVQIRNDVYNVFDIPRYKESYATFLVCSEIILAYAVNRDFLNDQEAQNYLLIFESAIHKVIAASDGNIVEHNPGIIVLQAIDNYMTSGVIKIYSEGQCPNQSDEYYAYIEDDYLCIKLEVAYRILLKHVRSLNSDPSVTTPKQLLPFLHALDVIRIEVKDGKTRNTHKLRNRNTDIRFLFIKRKKMLELLQNENLY